MLSSNLHLLWLWVVCSFISKLLFTYVWTGDLVHPFLTMSECTPLQCNITLQKLFQLAFPWHFLIDILWGGNCKMKDIKQTSFKCRELQAKIQMNLAHNRKFFLNINFCSLNLKLNQFLCGYVFVFWSKEHVRSINSIHLNLPISQNVQMNHYFKYYLPIPMANNCYTATCYMQVNISDKHEIEK